MDTEEPREQGTYRRFCKTGRTVSVGRFLGEGSYGTVFEHPDDPDRVIKIGEIWRNADSPDMWYERRYRGVIRFLKEIIRRPNGSIMRAYSFDVLATERAHSGDDDDRVFFALTGERLVPFSKKATADDASDMMEFATSGSDRIYRFMDREDTKGGEFRVTRRHAIRAQRDLRTYPYHHSDIHHHNVMRTSAGDIKLIDIESFEKR